MRAACGERARFTKGRTGEWARRQMDAPAKGRSAAGGVAIYARRCSKPARRRKCIHKAGIASNPQCNAPLGLWYAVSPIRLRRFASVPGTALSIRSPRVLAKRYARLEPISEVLHPAPNIGTLGVRSYLASSPNKARAHNARNLLPGLH
jgi:hypothetical protein